MKPTPLLLLLTLSCTLPRVEAATFTWSGGGTAGWNSAANWVGGSAPDFSNTTDLIWNSNAAARLGGGENAIAADRTVRSLSFNANADADIALRLTSGSGNTVGRTLTFEAASGNAWLEVDAGAAGSFTLGVAGPGTGNAIQIALASNLEVRHHGSGLLHFNRAVGGTGALLKSGAGVLRLSAANSYAGGTTLSGGKIEAANAAALGTGAVAIKAGGTLLVESGITLANTSLTLEAGGILQRAISSGGAYNLGTTGTVASALPGGTATTATLSGPGTASVATTLALSFSDISSALNDEIRLSDTLALSGPVAGDLFVLQLSISSGVDDLSRLVWFDTGADAWANAVAGNTSGGAHFVGDVAYNDTYFTLGNYGVDTASGTVWAVVDHAGTFAVAAIPEPSVAALAGGAGLFFLLRRRRLGNAKSAR